MSTILDKEAERTGSSLPQALEFNDKASTIASEEKSHGLNRDIEYAGVSRIEALCKFTNILWSCSDKALI